MKNLIKYLIFTLLVTFANSAITSYKAIDKCVDINSTIYNAIRVIKTSKNQYYLIVQPDKLRTFLINSSNTKDINCTNMLSKYNRLREFNNSSHPLQNDGIVSVSSGIYLTTDLCPSSKEGFEKRLYEMLIKNYKNPVPVALFITKKWIIKHKKEFNQLKAWQKEGKLDITWGNHTANHIYHSKVPLKENFVLSKEEHLKDDILELEQYLLENGVVPSIFFRFPGLVSDKNATNSVRELGLITIGSNSWLAKGEMPKDGSIILVHGNKNEPKGVDILIKLINNNKIKELDKIESIDIKEAPKNGLNLNNDI